MTFIDYEKAFDSVPTSGVIKALRGHGVDKPYISLLQDTYDRGTGTMYLHQKTNKFAIRKGIRQGDTISSILFTACLHGVLKKLKSGKTGTRKHWEHLSRLSLQTIFAIQSYQKQMVEHALYCIREVWFQV